MTVHSLTGAAGDWLATLDSQERGHATFAFDDPERFVWAYTPGERAGLALRDMRPHQRDAAMAVVDAALSERGAREVTDIIALESILGAIERDTGSSMWRRRDPALFWFAVFGDPAGDEPWSWRIGGHHIAISTTVANGRILGSTPSFLGANPAVVPYGPRAGFRALTGEETLARELLLSLSVEARRVAIVDPIAPPDIASGNGASADLRSVPSGIRYDDLERDGRARLEALIRHYLERATAEVATAEWERIAESGLEATTFAWAGPAEPGRGHYYAIHGEQFLIEYDNTQNGANHIHAVWRDLANDWGEDMLAAHYREGHAGG
ncbi:MAG TPA: DUF3500 domain-containing protein [Candidatus Limnocylindrales bacterium]|jgi:Protein of unknown function (DUF3500)|nr:DUF3500 domain-containing protein [Candidatus Limnocylindrales bacterium]